MKEAEQKTSTCVRLLSRYLTVNHKLFLDSVAGHFGMRKPVRYFHSAELFLLLTVTKLKAPLLLKS